MMAIKRKTDEVSVARRAKAQLQRQAEHVSKLAAYETRCNDPLTKEVAYSICQSVYRATGCACAKRPDMATCSTMLGAAMGAMRLTLRSVGQ